MFLNHEEIKALGIVEDVVKNESGDGSYNLTIELFIDMDNKISDSFKLKPQGMVYVVFKEKIKVPSNIIGFAHVKTSLTKLGIMATNIGIIDPCYEGYISTLLINFGKTELFINKGEAALRCTFSEIKGLSPSLENQKLVVTKDDYISKLQKNITHLDEKFLNLGGVKIEIIKEIWTNVREYAIVIAVIGLITSFMFNIFGFTDKKTEAAIKVYEQAVSTLNENNKFLQEQLKTYELKLKNVQDSLNAQQRLIKKLKN